MTIEDALKKVQGEWDDLPTKEKLHLMDLINDELSKLARSIEENFTPLLTEIGAPLAIHAEIHLSVTDNLRDPRLPENG